jgi:hypothetical protein
LTRISASGRESGVDMGAETAHVWDLIDGKIKMTGANTHHGQ